MGLFDGIFNTAPQQAAAGATTAALQEGFSDAKKFIKQGESSAQPIWTAGMVPFTTNLTQDQAGQKAYGDATGANGAQGYTDAVNSFHSSPGYNFALDQGTENVERKLNTTGNLASGGAMTALNDYAHGMADQDWQQYVTNLQPFIGASTANAAGSGTITAGNAGMYTTDASNLASMKMQEMAGIGAANANAANAQTGVSGNILNAGMQGASLIGGLLGFL